MAFRKFRRIRTMEHGNDNPRLTRGQCSVCGQPRLAVRGLSVVSSGEYSMPLIEENGNYTVIPAQEPAEDFLKLKTDQALARKMWIWEKEKLESLEPDLHFEAKRILELEDEPPPPETWKEVLQRFAKRIIALLITRTSASAEGDIELSKEKVFTAIWGLVRIIFYLLSREAETLYWYITGQGPPPPLL